MRKIPILAIATLFFAGCASIRQSVQPSLPKKMPVAIQASLKTREAIRTHFVNAARFTAEQSEDKEAILLVGFLKKTGLAYVTETGQVIQLRRGKVNTDILVVLPGEGPDFVQELPDGMMYRPETDSILVKGDVGEKDTDGGTFMILVARDAILPPDSPERSNRDLQMELLYNLAARITDKIKAVSNE